MLASLLDLCECCATTFDERLNVTFVRYDTLLYFFIELNENISIFIRKLMKSATNASVWNGNDDDDDENWTWKEVRPNKLLKKFYHRRFIADEWKWLKKWWKWKQSGVSSVCSVQQLFIFANLLSIFQILMHIFFIRFFYTSVFNRNSLSCHTFAQKQNKWFQNLG